MNEFLLVLGILLVIFGLIEGLWTSIWVDGTSAPFTSRLTSWIWKIFRRVIPDKKHKTLSLAGPVILVITVFSWIFFIWLGWTLMFYSDPGSLKLSDKAFTPNFTDAAWYVAFCMFTVGNGDFLPTDGIWQLLSALVAFTGMGMVTLAITYLLQVVSAVTNKRAFASEVTGIGKTAEEFVIKQWTGENFGAIELQLTTLSSQLAVLNEQHLSFPILHYYHAARMEKSMDMAIPILDDAITIIKLGMEEKNLPPETIISSLRQAIESFLTTVQSAFITHAKEVPPPPNLSIIKKGGVPVISEEEFYKKLENEQERRKLILGLVNNGSWRWPKNT